jgi:predicted permease
MRARLRSLFRGLVGRAQIERDLSDELEFHLKARVDHWVRQGLTPAEAARRARLEFGSVERYREAARHARGLRWFDELRGDLRYGLRSLAAAKGFTFVAVVMLGLAIGANTAVFSVLETVLFRVLPVRAPHELRELAWVEPNFRDWNISYDGSMRPYPGGRRIAYSFSYPTYVSLRDRTTSFSDLVLFRDDSLTVGLGDRDERAATLIVSGNFAGALGVGVSVGRPLAPDDDRPTSPPVAVLTDIGWQRLFGSDPRAVGRTITINGAAAVIVGVTPPGFFGLQPGWPVDMFVPVVPMTPVIERGREVLANPKSWAFRVMGRLLPDVADARAQVETEALLLQTLPPELLAPAPDERPRVVVNPGGQGLDSLRRSYSEPLFLLLAIMGGVLLIACANIAGLLLTRNAARGRELAVRLALGAGRGRIIRQLLTESVLLASMGGTIGLGLALAVRSQLLPLLNQDDPPIVLPLGFGPALWLFTMGLSLIVALLFGALPAWRATRIRATSGLTRSVSGTSDEGSRLFAGKTLVVFQVALSLVLVVGAGLFFRTLVNLRSLPLGFQADHLLTFRVDPTANGYEGARLLDYYERALARLGTIPGVSAVSFSRSGLLSGGATRDGITVPGVPAGQNEVAVHIHFVAPGHPETMGIPVLAGRDLAASDREAGPRVAMVNQTLARELPGGGAAIGRRIRLTGEEEDLEIVGVIGDAKFASLRDPAPRTLYLPYRQHRQHRMTFALRVAGEPASVAGPVRQAMAEIDPKVPLFDLRSQEEQIDLIVRPERLFAYVAGGFAVLALLLACLGIYGTLAYSVARRTGEIGLRMALGASRGDVIFTTLRESLVPVVVGVALGLGTAVATTGVIESMLYGLTPTDTGTLVAATVALAASALVAAWIPSFHASRLDPMKALRVE